MLLWWNRQTRQLEVLVGEIPYGFDPRTHHQSNLNWLQNKNATINGCCIWRVSSEE